MPNLVGTGLNQVPTNSMLGGLAYQDPEHASIKNLDLKNLSQINAEIADTAVDVFVYDTRKDSDGGAWRKRTQNTSWYNETLGTTTRGSRKEFPAVAVIVIESQKIRIYDGDDPDLPMWMVFEINEYTNGGNLGKTPIGIGHVSSHPYNSVSLSSVHMLNGFLFIGGNRNTNASSVHAGYDINFISEVMHEYLHYPTDASATTKWKLNGNVSQRNSTAVVENPSSRYSAGGSSVGLKSVVNDVSMTVLPNAPIDDTTGLPVPTIAVATNGGLSVIKDDGTVVDWIETSGPDSVHKVNFRKDNKLGVFTSGTSGATGYPQLYYIDIPSLDISSGYYYDFSGNNIERYGGTAWETNSDRNLVMKSPATNPLVHNLTDMVDTPNLTYSATNGGLNAIIRPESLNGATGRFDMRTAAIAYIQKDYNTGWMHGDIKGAFLSDTDTTNLTGGNKVTNGDAWSGAQSSTSSTPPTGWTGGNAAQFKTHSGGDGTYIRLVNAGSAQGGPNSYMSQAITTVAGRKYKISVTQYHHATISVYFRAGTQETYSDLIQNSWTSSSSATPRYEQNTFTATGTTTYITLGIVSGTNNYDTGWDNVVVTEVDEDRSVNANGLHSFGTITKSPVATGADLVAYSGFSNSDYLMQPHNTDLEIGTGEISISAWFKSSTSDTGNYKGLFYLNNPGSLGPGLQVMFGPSNGIYLYIYGASGSQNFGGSYQSGYNDGNWHQVLVSTKPGQQQIYVDGILKETGTVNTGSMTNSTSELYIGRWYGNANVSSYWWRGDIALVRVSRSIPTAEQIKKMYEDEKVLFHENAKCTLYGSSDAVTALAYDDTTNLLHVGTSAGRSEFQGLRRINNTTDAVTTAISASNGFVAEQ
jgi:hypothetical protein